MPVPPIEPKWWEAVSAWGAAGSALLAAISTAVASTQLWLSRRDANRRAAMEQLRLVGTLLEAYLPFAAEDPRPGIIRRYRRESDDLPRGASAYMALLNQLDLTAFGIQRGMFDGRTALDYLKTLFADQTVTLSFLRELQGCCGNACIYEHLYKLMVDLSGRERAANTQAPPLPTLHASHDAQREATRTTPTAPSNAAHPSPAGPHSS